MTTTSSCTSTLIDKVEACLAQTQCTECGYNGCRPYAKAVVEEGVSIGKCRPGGARVVAALAKVLDKPVVKPEQEPLPAVLAVVDEDVCIGCTKCIQACPTDAIIGAPKMKHTVISKDCSGCRLCLPVCPVDCIALEKINEPEDPIARQIELKALMDAKKERLARKFDRDLAALDERVEKQGAEQALPPEIVAKIAAAREKSQKKYAAKGESIPKLFRDKKRDE
ncbi:MAG: RnfABCDGE type electron transport complex subunit B [Alphaproteobacteria bacterium]|nr:RnfABCDGE type electron transport complex subunit B [Alphaproteobacteria bacterium]MDD9919260.1 RnfABCDGE type electron transport complex subunit B [Alphaproteobacteria bacterium]